MADEQRPAVGTVAEEAARLLDALGGWATTARAGYAAGSADADTSPDEPPDSTLGPDGSGSPAAGTESTTSRCESCGAENGVGQAVTCQVCPVCQGIALLRSVRPETVDRLADLAGALAATLRDIAGQRRAAPDPTTPRGRPTPSSRVQDIPVEDDDAPGSATS